MEKNKNICILHITIVDCARFIASSLSNFANNLTQEIPRIKYKLIHTNFLTMIKATLFFCCKEVFILMNILMIGKNLMKYHYLKNKVSTVT